MRNKLFVLNTLLAGLTLSVVWTLQAQYESDCRSSAALAETPIKLLPDLPGADIVKPAAFNGSEYVAVTQKNLFTVDRNSEPIVDAPPPPIIRTMPALPVVTGVLGMPSGMVAIVSEKSDGSSRTVRVGEKIGEFRLIALTQRH